MAKNHHLFEAVSLPCGAVLKNRIAKSAMSDSLGDGTGHPTVEQIKLYQRWAKGGVGLSIIGEVQTSPYFVEKPGNLVLDEASELKRFEDLAEIGKASGNALWLQLGHAGALAYRPTSTPKGPSALDLPGLNCGEMTLEEIHALPQAFAQTAKLAQKCGFDGVQIHAAHGFLLSQFLSPLFNKRQDAYGGSIAHRMRLLLEVIEASRAAVGPEFPIGVKINATDQLEGGLAGVDALQLVLALENTSIDLIDISGGTYFPGAKSSSDAAGKGPYFFEFAQSARALTTKPLMLTGGFKTFAQADAAIESGVVDIVGLARALIIEPSLPHLWQSNRGHDPLFPRFSDAPAGGITAWYTMCMTHIAAEDAPPNMGDLHAAIADYEARDAARTAIWLRHFGR